MTKRFSPRAFGVAASLFALSTVQTVSAQSGAPAAGESQPSVSPAATPPAAQQPAPSAQPVALPAPSAQPSAQPTDVGSITPAASAEPAAPAEVVVERDVAIAPDATTVAREIAVVTPAAPAAPAQKVDAAKADVVGPAAESTGGWSLNIGSYRARVSGYVQAQYQHFKQSEDQLSSDGLRLLNNTGVYIPRARMLIEGEHDWSALVLEYDVANRSASGVGVIRAEGTLHWRKNPSTLPYAEFTMGMFRTPFGAEVVRSARVRMWTEMPTVFQAFWPGQSDVGVRNMPIVNSA